MNPCGCNCPIPKRHIKGCWYIDWQRLDDAPSVMDVLERDIKEWIHKVWERLFPLNRR